MPKEISIKHFMSEFDGKIKNLLPFRVNLTLLRGLQSHLRSEDPDDWGVDML